MKWRVLALVSLLVALSAAPSFAESSDTSSYWNQADETLNELELQQKQLLSKIKTLESQSISDKELLAKQETSLTEVSDRLRSSAASSRFYETATWTLLAIVAVETLIIILK